MNLLRRKKISIQLQKEVGDVITELKKLQKENSDFHTVNKSLDKSLSEKEKVSSELMKELQKERSIYQQKLSEAKSKGEDLITEQRARISYLESHLAKKGI
ncbi:hypothetical protein Avbf_05937 [Armadillidium vulgare]|nr:hypothetical protein Avbf_05937 [Armadillidium vulgare]